MVEERFYVHHVGGRGGTVSFPDVSGFASHVYNVIYDADPDCVAEIAAHWDDKTTVLPYCLGDARRDSVLHLNYCPFTSSVFPFNEEFGEYYEEKRLGYSDYVFAKSFEPQRELTLRTESLDELFAESRIPRVDFLSVDTQGSELAILRGAERLLTTVTVAVCCEVNFTDLYRGAPLFGEVDGFLRSKGFLLASLAPMSFGYRRISRDFRGPGVPVQGEALYLLKPGRVANESPDSRQRRLEKLAFSALAFGYTEVAYEAVEMSISIDQLASTPVQQFLRRFHQQVFGGPPLPPLWHSLEGHRPSATPSAPPQAARGPFPLTVARRLLGNPGLFIQDLRRFLRNHVIRLLFFLRLEKLGFNRFESFLARYGFIRAAQAVYLRRIR